MSMRPYGSGLGLSKCLGPGECLHSFISMRRCYIYMVYHYRTSELQSRTPLLIKYNIKPRRQKRIHLVAAVGFFAAFLRFFLNFKALIHCAGGLLVFFSRRRGFKTLIMRSCNSEVRYIRIYKQWNNIMLLNKL